MGLGVELRKPVRVSMRLMVRDGRKKKKEKENETEISHMMPGRFKAHRTTRDNPSFSQSNLRSDRRTDTGHWPLVDNDNAVSEGGKENSRAQHNSTPILVHGTTVIDPGPARGLESASVSGTTTVGLLGHRSATRHSYNVHRRKKKTPNRKTAKEALGPAMCGELVDHRELQRSLKNKEQTDKSSATSPKGYRRCELLVTGIKDLIQIMIWQHSWQWQWY